MMVWHVFEQGDMKRGGKQSKKTERRCLSEVLLQLRIHTPIEPSKAENILDANEQKIGYLAYSTCHSFAVRFALS
jgi:hypothetical protein